MDRLQTQWRQIREQFAASDESLDELTAATLIQQWLATAHKDEFQAYELQMVRKEEGQGRGGQGASSLQ